MNKSVLIESIMRDFADRTCISGKRCMPIRYLWTDAFAVCNLLELFRKTAKERYKEEALKLVDQVHHVLGKHRPDDTRSGWISGLEEEEGEAHPAIGGLRIGKKQNERKQDDPYDERQEWEQDGQYFHYLTKWMHALDLVSEATGDAKYRRWALELAQTAYEGFTYVTLANAKRMYWKMSIDLSYPLVASMGQHDALDGYITYLELERAASGDKNTPDELCLGREMTGLLHMSQTINWKSEDPLGIGGLLADAYMLTMLIIDNKREEHSGMLLNLLAYALEGVEGFLHTDTLKYPAQYRLAFREFGLSIGLHGVAWIQTLVSKYSEYFSEPAKLQELLSALEVYSSLCGLIEDFWLDDENQKSSTWIEHLDINAVMLATSLDPEGYLRI